MKNENNKKTWILIILVAGLMATGMICTLNTLVFAETIPPNNVSKVVDGITSELLTVGQIQDIASSGQGVAASEPLNSDVLSLLRGAATSEGVEESGSGPDARSIIENAYSTVDRITKALEDRLLLPFGKRIGYLLDSARNIIKYSGKRIDEALSRIVLNRTLDYSAAILPVAGYNSDEIARWESNFIKSSFELAAAYANRHVVVQTSENRPSKEYPFRDNSGLLVQHIPVAEFGHQYATLLWRNSTALTSNTSKALVLMKLTGYLGRDLNVDTCRREPQIAKTIADVYELQQSGSFQKILQDLKAGYEPTQANLNDLRTGVWKILQRLNVRMSDLDPRCK